MGPPTLHKAAPRLTFPRPCDTPGFWVDPSTALVWEAGAYTGACCNTANPEIKIPAASQNSIQPHPCQDWKGEAAFRWIFRAPTAREWQRLISAAFVFHHWPLPALIVKGESFCDDSFVNANSVFLAREQGGQIFPCKEDRGRRPLVKISDGHIPMKGTIWLETSVGTLRSDPASCPAHLNHQEKPVWRQMAGVKGKGGSPASSCPPDADT